MGIAQSLHPAGTLPSPLLRDAATHPRCLAPAPLRTPGPPCPQYCLNLSAPFICEVPPFKKTLMDLMPYVDYLFGNGEKLLFLYYQICRVVRRKDVLCEKAESVRAAQLASRPFQPVS